MSIGTVSRRLTAMSLRRSRNCLLLRPLIFRHVLIDIFQFVIAVLDYRLHHVVLVQDDRFEEYRRHILLTIVDGVILIGRAAARKLDCRIYRAKGQRLNWLVYGHGLLAL